MSAPPSGQPSCAVTLELARGDNAGDPFAFQFVQQTYLRRQEGGTFQSAIFPWSQAFLDDLARLGKAKPDRRVVQRLGDALRSFLASLGWDREEARIEEALRNGQRVHLTIRSAAAELFCLPWELVTLRASGEHLVERAGCLLRYEWPVDRPVAAPARLEGRILFAWSAAGGPVPAHEHLQAIQRACRRGKLRFDRQKDVLARASSADLSKLLAESSGPIAALHLLCHGGKSPSGAYSLLWNPSQAEGTPELLDAGALRQLLAPHAQRIQMVVLCACHSGDADDIGSHLGSAAQALHRVEIPVVVASRLPLSTEGSIKLTETLYMELLAKRASLERAMLAARGRLAEDLNRFDWVSLQLYARAGVLERQWERVFPARATRALVGGVAAVVAASSVWMAIARPVDANRSTPAAAAAAPPLERPLRGQIFNEDNEPVPGVKVSLDELNRTAETDQLGRFEFRVASEKQMTVKLISQKDGYRTDVRKATLGNTGLGFTLCKVHSKRCEN